MAVGTHRLVIRVGDVNGRIDDGARTTGEAAAALGEAKHIVELVVVPFRKEHRVMTCYLRGAGNSEAQHKPAQAWLTAPQTTKRRSAGAAGRDQIIVEMGRVSVGDHNAGVYPAAIGEHHSPRRAVAHHNFTNICARTNINSQRDAPIQQRFGDSTQSSVHVPCAEMTFGIGHRRQRRRSPAGVRTRVRGISIDERHQARIIEVRLRHRSQGPARSNRDEIVHPNRLFHQVPWTPER